ncbi:AAA domain-containing protein [uncultured Draconibacterium sp.]|uniref:AAA domain-containing protein n=1 Tax=uncultured Draconibacterium sp. TaxID=1573823 RepID=UPI0029C83767|nr:AAA domain-containing protein [uncultured Draconibacterium sp.]
MAHKITVTEIGEYIRHSCCERRFKLSYNNREEAEKIPFADRLFNTIDPVLKKSGERKENEWNDSLLVNGYTSIGTDLHDGEELDLGLFINKVNELDIDSSTQVFGREVKVNGVLSDFELSGRIDFLIFTFSDNIPKIKIVECKASRRDRTYHRIQVGIYKLLLLEYFREKDISIAGVSLSEGHIECVVARIDESTNKNQDILELEPLIQDREESDILHLLSHNGPLAKIINSEVDILDFQLDLKCDGCVFNVHCLTESGRKRSLELLSINPTASRILRQNGLHSIDDLADLDLASGTASSIRNNPSFSYNLGLLAHKAKARRSTLPEGEHTIDEYPVQPYPFNITSQLPEYEIDGEQLIRVYMAVDYDYVENRVVSLSAHVTKSLNEIRTDYESAEVFEITHDESRSDISGEIIIETVDSIWNGDYAVDNAVERQLISSFFRRIVDAIANVADEEEAPIHFYVWTRNEIKALVEACSRVDTVLLSHFNQLLGCRQSLEQLIFSCLHDEVDNRYALGWTGRGLAVVTSLPWFGQRYYWRRKISNTIVSLDHIFTQDIFDFKTDLFLTPEGEWATDQDPRNNRFKFEIRSRFNDGLTVPYWHAYWGVLPTPDTLDDHKVRASVVRYNNANRPGYLREFLKSRIIALRWIEERIRFKNPEIEKPLIEISSLNQFNLNVNHTRRAALDFLRLDFHVSLNDWLAKNMLPPINRIMNGETIPISNLRVNNGNLVANIDFRDSGLNESLVRDNCSYSEDSFVRVSPCNEDFHRGQSIRQHLRGGITATIRSINWENNLVILDPLFARADGSNYILSSFNPIRRAVDVYPSATIDESISDFVANRVDARLLTNQGEHINRWFDPETPEIPELEILANEAEDTIRKLLSEFVFEGYKRLQEDQINAILDGLKTRVQLLLGPPGTGKTMTTAIAILTMIMHNQRVGSTILIAANTHMAVDNLLERINSIKEIFNEFIRESGRNIPNINIAKIVSGDVTVDGIEEIRAGSHRRRINQLCRDSVLILGGTTSALLKMAAKNGNTEFTTHNLIIDEASMMIFPHFLSLATLLEETGKILLAGDHRQLSPIISHDWEKEDRPPVIKYQPYLSSYEAVRKIYLNSDLSLRSICTSALEYTFRLPADIRDLIARLYREDEVNLSGTMTRHDVDYSTIENIWDKLWATDTGIYLVLHNERESRKSNNYETHIINEIIGGTGYDIEDDSIAIITPHRAQRTLLTNELTEHETKISLIDTVERLQGGEKPTIIVSATASDPSAIGANAEFILSLNRANVAFSRAQKRLIIVCSEALINYIPAEIEHYDSALLWKTLRNICNNKISEIDLNGHNISIFTLTRED